MTKVVGVRVPPPAPPPAATWRQGSTRTTPLRSPRPCRKPYRRCGRIDQLDRRPDQPARAQRHHRGGESRRGGPGLCRRRRRGQGAGRTDLESDRRNRPADRGYSKREEQSVGAIGNISATIGRLSEISATIAASVEQQGGATQEISRNVQQAVSGTTQVSSSIGEVQHGASETGSASSQVLSSARALTSESHRLKSEMARFLGSIRAA